MKSILEKAVVHLLNEEHEKAEALFHRFMVERARQIHESLRQGEEVALNEGWDDEITSEEYFTETDLADAEDADGEADLGAEGDDAAADDLAADLTGDAGVDGDEFAVDGDVEGDVEGDDALDADADLGAEGAEGDVDTRLTDIEDEIEKLSSEFEALMAEFDGEAEVDGSDDEFADADADVEGVEGDVDGGADLADQMSTDMTDGNAAEDETVHEGDDEFDDLDEITESVIAELEKVAVSLETDGKEIGTGKSFTQNSKSNLPAKKADHNDAKPFVLKSDKHEGFERETAPAVKSMPKRKNTKTNAEDGRSAVSADGDKSAVLNKDFAGRPQK